MAHLSLSLLGGFQATLDGEPVAEFESAKVRALLAYLAVEADRLHRRETLGGLLWPDRPEPSARNNLRHALAVLRRAIGDHIARPPHLLITRETIQFNRASDHWLDVETFGNLVDARQGKEAAILQLERAVSLYRGGFLDGFSVKGSPAFEDWALLTREWIQRRAMAALQWLASEYERCGEYERACELARRQVGLEPWQEEGHRQVMRLLVLTGRRSAALAQYEVCRRALAEELGVEPEEETTALYRRIRDGTLRKTAQPPRAGIGEHRDVRQTVYNLPAPLTPLIGREAALDEIARLLQEPACRLLSLVGPGGIGKTHLALEVATKLASSDAGLAGQRRLFGDGICFVPLGPVQAVEAIVPAIAQALRFALFSRAHPEQRSSARQQLLNYVQQRNLLLVLDNFEHLLGHSPSAGEDGASLVAGFLGAAPDLKMLVTSRTRLGVPGEHLFVVPALSFPAERLNGRAPHLLAASATPARMTQYSAVKLFLESARRVTRDFESMGDDLAYIADICYLVQGNPLGILLAASWIAVMAPAEIAAEIGKTFDFLTTDWRGLPERQRSMRTVLDHSWHLLTEREQEVLAGLSVFRGSFARQVAHYVTGASMPELRSLVNRSLVQRAPTGRYGLHELLRQYAEEKLDQSPAAHAVARDRHSAYYTTALQAWGADLQGPRQQSALAEMDVEIDNARAAWDWAAGQRHVERLSPALEGLGHYYERRLRHQEGEAAFNGAAEGLRAARNLAAGVSGDVVKTLAMTLAFQALFAQTMGRTEVARDLLEQGLGLLEGPELCGQDSRSEEAFLWSALGWLGRQTGRGGSREPFERSLALYRSLGDRWGTARALCALGRVADFEARDYGEARRKLEESAAIFRTLGDTRGIAEAALWLSWVHQFEGQAEESERLARKAVAVLRELSDPAGVAQGLSALASALWWAGKYAESQARLEERLAIYDELGVRDSFGLLGLGWVNMHQGRSERARACLQTGLAIAREMDDLQMVADALHQLGHVAVCEGACVEANRLLLESLPMYQTIGTQDNLGMARCVLGYAARGLGDVEQVRLRLGQALRSAEEWGSFPMLVYALPGAALLLLDRHQEERAVEIYALARRLPAVANSRWFADVVGRHVAAAAATLPPDVVAEAEERGRGRDLQATLQELLEAWGE